MTPATFEHLLRGSRVIRVEGNVWTVQIPIPQALDWLEDRLAPVIRRNLDFDLPGIRLRFVARGRARTVCIVATERACPAGPAPEPIPSRWAKVPRDHQRVPPRVLVAVVSQPTLVGLRPVAASQSWRVN
jgi:hypothetical protein